MRAAQVKPIAALVQRCRAALSCPVRYTSMTPAKVTRGKTPATRQTEKIVQRRIWSRWRFLSKVRLLRMTKRETVQI